MTQSATQLARSQDADSAGENMAPSVALVVIGASVSALHVLSRLPKPILEDVVVVDARGEWLGSFASRHRLLGTKLLRNPINQIPHPKPTLLKEYIKRKKALDSDASQVLPGFLPLPSPSLFEKFCRDEVLGSMPANIQDVVRDRVTDVTRLSGDDASSKGLGGSGCRVSLASGRSLYSRAVVFCSSAQSPVIPAWAQSVVGWPSGTREGDGLGVLESAPLVLHTRDLEDYSDAVYSKLLQRRRVLIVGGGPAAVQMALHAEKSGAATVALIARSAIREANFDCDPAFAGGLGQARFAEQDSIPERLSFCRRARPGGTVPGYLLQELRAVEKEAGNRVLILEGKEVATADTVGQSLQIAIKESTMPGSGKQRKGAPKTDQASLLDVDLVLLATGTQTHAAADPLLAAMCASSPVRIVGGYPVLDHSTCSWPGLEMFIVGKLAALSLGPIAAEPLGLREAASRVVKVLDSRPKDSVTPWSLQSAPDNVEGDLDLPLDGEDTVEAIKRTSWLVDPTTVPDCLARKEFAKYGWFEDGFIVSIHLPVPELVSNNAVHYVLLKRSIDLWVVGSSAAYHFQIPKFYATVITDRCTVKYSEKTQKVVVKLHKFSDEPWRFLKSQI